MTFRLQLKSFKDELSNLLSEIGQKMSEANYEKVSIVLLEVPIFDFPEIFNCSYRRGVLNKYIFEHIDQVREQTASWMQDYNHKRPHESLGGKSPVQYAETNSHGASPMRIKNNNFIEILDK